jgi:hypothetical protein
LRQRAAELAAEAPPDVTPVPAPAPTPVPHRAIVPPTPAVHVTPEHLPALDGNLDARTRQAVIAMLTSETDPAKLQGFAGAIAGHFPLSAALLWAKAAAEVAQHPPPIAPPPAVVVPTPGPAPPGPTPIVPAPTPAPVAVAPPSGYTWRLATDADVTRDGAVGAYQSLLSSPIGTQIQRVLNGRAWQFRVISKATDPGLTTYARDVKGWVGTPIGQLPAPVPTPTPTPFVPSVVPSAPSAVVAPPSPRIIPGGFAPVPATPSPVVTNQQVQMALNVLGYTGANGAPLKVDGIIGPQSQGAVRKFQADHSLKVDAIPGPITKSALSSALAQKGLSIAA